MLELEERKKYPFYRNSDGKEQLKSKKKMHSRDTESEISFIVV